MNDLPDISQYSKEDDSSEIPDGEKVSTVMQTPLCMD